MKLLTTTPILVSAFLLSTNAMAGVVGWPDVDAPCNGSLEACLENIDDGDIVEIRTNAPGEQQAAVSGKSFTLRPGPGFAPVFDGFSSIFAGGADHDVSVVIEGLVIPRGRIRANQGGSGVMDVTIRNNQVSSDFDTPIRVGSGNTAPLYGPVHFVVENNIVNVNVEPNRQVSGIGICCFQADGNYGVVNNNRITQFGGDQNGAIDIGIGSFTLDVDVIGNIVQGANFNEGVGIFKFGDFGDLNARIINNIISGQTNDAGAPAAISLNVSGGNSYFEVINNTVAFNDRGLYVGGRADLGATVSGIAANNIFAFNDGFGISIDQDFFNSFTNEHNLVHGNGSNFFIPGPITITQNPQFVSDATLVIGPNSPARDIGATPLVPVDITQDVMGANRVFNFVDIGAVEIQGPELVFAGGFED